MSSLCNGSRSKEIEYAWEDVKALFNGGSRKRTTTSTPSDDDEAAPPRKISANFSSNQELTTLSHSPTLNLSPATNVRAGNTSQTGGTTNFPVFPGLAHPLLR